MPSSHGNACGGKAYPSTCGGCKRPIFYFHCSHGSKVFFDELGGGWPQHACQARNSTTSLNIERNVARMPRGGVFEDGAFPGILVWNGGYTRAESPVIQPRPLVQCKRCGVPRSDPRSCCCKRRPLTKDQDERRRAGRKLAKGVFLGPEHKKYLEDAVSGRGKWIAITTIAAPRIRTDR